MSTSNRFLQLFSIFLFIVAAPLVLGGLQLLFLGGSFYYLFAGLALAYTAWRLWESDPRASLVYAFLFFFTISPAKSDEGLLSIVSRFGHQPGDSPGQRFFWNRLRYETSTEMGDVCYAEAAYELMPFWFEDRILLRNLAAAKNSTSRIYRVDDFQPRLFGKETIDIGEETVLDRIWTE